jgi:hypothetical protein
VTLIAGINLGGYAIIGADTRLSYWTASMTFSDIETMQRRSEASRLESSPVQAWPVCWML